jgi:hypothetical protein
MMPADVELDGGIKNRDEVEEMMTSVYNAADRSLYEPLQYDTKIWVTGHRTPDEALLALEDTEIGFVAVFETDRKFVDVGFLTSKGSDSQFGIEVRDNLGNSHWRLYQNPSQQLDPESEARRIITDVQTELAEERVILE